MKTPDAASLRSLCVIFVPVSVLKVTVCIFQAFTSASQGFLNCLVYGWTRLHLRRAGLSFFCRDVDTQTPLLRSQQTRNYLTWGGERLSSGWGWGLFCCFLPQRLEALTFAFHRRKNSAAASSTSGPEPPRRGKRKRKSEGGWEWLLSRALSATSDFRKWNHQFGLKCFYFVVFKLIKLLQWPEITWKVFTNCFKFTFLIVSFILQISFLEVGRINKNDNY